MHFVASAYECDYSILFLLFLYKSRPAVRMELRGIMPHDLEKIRNTSGFGLAATFNLLTTQTRTRARTHTREYPEGFGKDLCSAKGSSVVISMERIKTYQTLILSNRSGENEKDLNSASERMRFLMTFNFLIKITVYLFKGLGEHRNYSTERSQEGFGSLM